MTSGRKPSTAGSHGRAALCALAVAAALAIAAHPAGAHAGKATHCKDVKLGNDLTLRKIHYHGMRCGLARRLAVKLIAKTGPMPRASQSLMLSLARNDWSCFTAHAAYAAGGTMALNAECDLMSYDLDGLGEPVRWSRVNFQIWNL